MRQRMLCFGLGALLLTQVYADGYVWLSGAGEMPARVFRYNLRTGQIDRVVEPGRWGFVQSQDYNLLAYDGNDLYVGLENDRTLLKLNPLHGRVALRVRLPDVQLLLRASLDEGRVVPRRRAVARRARTQQLQPWNPVCQHARRDAHDCILQHESP
jgi:hypothetical protein